MSSNVTPIDPLACQVDAANSATRYADWCRQIENQTIRANLAYAAICRRTPSAPPPHRQAWVMVDAILACVEQTNRDAS